jgi:hypothetical protein
MSVPQPPSRTSACLAPVRLSTKGLQLQLGVAIATGYEPCSRSTRCNTRSSGSLVLTPHVHSRSPTPATLQFATTAALADVTHVARHLGLRARVRPPARTPLATPEVLVVLSLPRLLLSTPTGAGRGLDPQYHTLAAILQSNYVSPTKSFLTPTSTISATPMPGTPS